MANDHEENTGQVGSPFDPYNFSDFSEIEKIQIDIERDLHPHIDQPESLSSSTQIAPLESYYSETIKQENPSIYDILAKHRRLVAVLLVVCTLGAGTLGAAVGFSIVFLHHRMAASSSPAGHELINVSDDTSESTRLIFGSNGSEMSREGLLSDVVRLVDPAVVRITTVPHQQNSAPTNPFNALVPNQQQRYGGSGIIFEIDSENIFIVTNDHVTRGSSEVNVFIMDSEPIQARFVGRNLSADIVVLAVSTPAAARAGVNLNNVRTAVFGDSDAMRVGDIVLAIGNAMGEGNSTTSGIISAEEREAYINDMPMQVLQTDAAINPGNSGGPLVNNRGEVIGINKSFNSVDNQMLEGMGFSVPSNVVKPIIERIMNSPPSPFLGIVGSNVNDAIANQYGVLPIGAYVTQVFENSSAERAGIKPGDIITSFNNHTIFDMEELIEVISWSTIGDVVEVTALRNGSDTMVFQVMLGVNINNNF